MLTQYFEAFEYANRAHRKQHRKVNGTPYISHPMAVAFTLEKMGCCADLVIAGVLHDVLEDTDTTEADLAKRFGDKVLRLVKSVTENKRLTSWDDRKQDYISRISAAATDARILSMADKIHNLYSLHSDISEFGDDIWLNFNAPKHRQKWYYATLLQVFKQDASQLIGSMIPEMERLIEGAFLD
jgi:(p)ppGpp synthase/HD superfamily hydrolase